MDGHFLVSRIHLLLHIYGIIYCSAKTTKGTKDSHKEEPNSEAVECYYRKLKKNEIAIHVWGVVGMDENTKQIVSGGVAQETEQIFQHMKTILDKHGTSFKRVATFKFFVKDKSCHPVTEEILKKYVEPPLPGRSLIEQHNLTENANIECEFVAFVGKKMDRYVTQEIP